MALGILTERAGSERDIGPAAAQRASASSFARAATCAGASVVGPGCCSLVAPSARSPSVLDGEAGGLARAVVAGNRPPAGLGGAWPGLDRPARDCVARVKGLWVVLVACVAAGAACALAPGVAAARSCGGSLMVGAGEIVLTATSINVFGGVTCSRGRQVVRAYFRCQLRDLEGCAAPARTRRFAAAGCSATRAIPGDSYVQGALRRARRPGGALPRARLRQRLTPGRARFSRAAPTTRLKILLGRRPSGKTGSAVSLRYGQPRDCVDCGRTLILSPLRPGWTPLPRGWVCPDCSRAQGLLPRCAAARSPRRRRGVSVRGA